MNIFNSSSRRTILIVAGLLSSLWACGQLGAPLRKNAVVVEYSYWGLNSERCLTICYERIFAQKGAINYYLKAGGGEWGGPWKNSVYPFGAKFSAGLGAYLGKRTHHLDVQAGPELYITTGDNDNTNINPPQYPPPALHAYALAGYRFQQPGRPLMFRISIASYGLLTTAVGFTF